MLRLILVLGVSAVAPARQQDGLLRGPPLHYDAVAKSGAVERLARRLEAGLQELAFDPEAGYLPGLLAALDIPVSSQTLVFSKTSFQDELISPRTPRAIYFGEQAYVATIPGAPIVEITSMDPERGPVFYTLEQDAERVPRFTRRDDECLQCHVSSRTRGWPGNLVRSVHPDASGLPILRSGTEAVTHATPFEKRWGGWYVSGTHGSARHRGNAVAAESTERVDEEDGANVVDLTGFFDTERYLAPHSDIVALMVFEHQAEMHNRLARAAYEVRLALDRQEETNRFLGEPPGTRRPSTERILESQAANLLRYLLFEKEVRLAAPIRGTSTFAAEFQAKGPRDRQGRSLRDLDLRTRLFRNPCSYLIYTPAFDALPAELLEVVYRELWSVLTAAPGDDGWRLTKFERDAVREILLATKEGLPDTWRP